MTKLRIKLNKRAISPVIATLLLIAIAVAVSVVTYSWTMSMAQNQSTQSQTSVKIDQVLFGRETTATTTTVLAAPPPTASAFTVDDAGDFAAGDVIQVNGEARVIDTVVGDAITLTQPLSAIPVTDNVVTLLNDGAVILVRNTGSIAATIEVAYVYQGDQLIGDGISVNKVLSPGATNGIGITTADHTNLLKSGGAVLPPEDTLIPAAFTTPLTENTAYTIRLITSTGFIVEGTYYTPGSW